MMIENDAKVRISRDDVTAFSRISHDLNPIHLDEQYSYNTAYGRPIVHGLLAVLSCLKLLKCERKTVRSMKIDFRGPVFVDVEYRLAVAGNADITTVKLLDGVLVLLSCQLTFTESAVERPPSDAENHRALIMRSGVSFETVPSRHTDEELSGRLEITGHYEALTPAQRLVGAGFIPHWLGDAAVNLVLLSSYIVGMRVPGERSLLLKLTIQFPDQLENQAVDYTAAVDAYNTHYRSADIVVRCFHGARHAASIEARAFVRKELAPTPLREIRSLLGSSAFFQNKVALVTGASRGLGADLVRALALRGCHVFVNFSRNTRLAQDLQAQLRDAAGQVILLQGDAGDRALWEQAKVTIAEKFGRLDILICNACEAPMHMEPGPATASRADRYIERNLALIRAPLQAFVPLLEESGGHCVAISSAMVETRPRNYGHYVHLKNETERLARRYFDGSQKISLLIVRPPALLTEMANTPANITHAVATAPVAARVLQELEHLAPRQWTMADRFEDAVSPGGSSDAADVLVTAATFTAQPILHAQHFWRDQLGGLFSAEVLPQNLIARELLDPASRYRGRRRGLNVMLVRLEDWLYESPDGSGGHGRAFEVETAHFESVSNDVLSALRQHQESAHRSMLVVFCPASEPFVTDAQWQQYFSTQEERLLRACGEIPGVTAIRSADFHRLYGVSDFHDRKRAALARIPYTPSYYHFLGTLIARCYVALTQQPYKVIVVDCDNTLWSGLCGEDTISEIAITEDHRRLQQFLKDQVEKGFLLCLCSKNEEENVWRVFDSHSGMVLDRADVVAHRINWLPKSENLSDLAGSLGLGLDAFVFLDDDPVECEEVRMAHPEVLAVCISKVGSGTTDVLEHLWVFDRLVVTAEDRNRAQYYRSEQDRARHREQSSSFETFLQSLRLTIDYRPISAANIGRVSQLIQRTNQFNTSSKRYTDSEISVLAARNEVTSWVIDVRDRFGDYGTAGLLLFRIEAAVLTVDTFLLSCRVLGRGVEDAVMAALRTYSEAQGVSRIRFLFRRTAKNRPVELFLEQLGEGGRKELAGDDVFYTFLPEQLCRLRSVRDAPAPGPPPPAGTARARQAGPDLLLSAARAHHDFHELVRAIDDGHRMVPADAREEEPRRAGSLVDELKTLFSSASSIPVEEVAENEPLASLGLDSFAIVDLTVELDSRFKGVPPTLLFECPTIGKIAGYLEKNYPEAVRDRYGVAGPAPVPSILERTSRNEPLRWRDNEPIAIVGFHGVYPGAPDLPALWENLKSRRSCISEITTRKHLFPAAGPEAVGMDYCRWAGLIDDVDRFEPKLFGISPKEAEMMDPQQRLFLQVVWGLLESAGYTRSTLPRDTGVFVGVTSSDYGVMENAAALAGSDGYRLADYYQIANRVSHVFDLQGPSFAVDAACASSGTALHLGCESIKNGDCKVAIVGGVNLILHPSRLIQYSRTGMLSPGNECRPFAQAADGTILGEGIGAVMMKSLAQAEADRDQIHGIIRATAINNEGRTNGFTVPSPETQSKVIRTCLERAGVDPRAVSYVEAHGTGTPLGDPIEIRGLCLAFEQSAGKRDAAYCAIGSIKSNIGHTESNAAIAGLTKVLLQMRYRQLVPSLHASQLNSRIDFERTPFVVQQDLAPWRPAFATGGVEKEHPRIAGISSFGAGGANAHVIVEEYVVPEEPDTALDGTAEPSLFVLSAATEGQLRDYAGKLLAFVRSEAADGVALALPELAYTLQTGREAMPERMGFLARSMNDLEEHLRDCLSGDGEGRIFRGRSRSRREDPASSGLDPDESSRLAGWVEKKQFDQILLHWVAGGSFDWTLLYGPRQPRRAWLPTRSFAGQRYWLPQPMEAGNGPVQDGQPEEPAMYRPSWKPVAITGHGSRQDHREHLVFRLHDRRSERTRRDHGIEGTTVVDVECGRRPIEEEFPEVAAELFMAVREMLGRKPDRELFVQVVAPSRPDAQLFAGLSGLLRTAQAENPRFSGQLILHDRDCTEREIRQWIATNGSCREDKEIRYRNGIREVRGWERISQAGDDAALPWKDGGIYLITGGGGRLGQIFAEEIARRSSGSVVVLAGRSEPSAATRESVARIATLGARIEYRRADVCDRGQVTALIEDVTRRYGRLDGVLHAAGVIRDDFILRKSVSDFEAVLAPKVTGTVVLDEATRHLALDFFILFSSTSAFGNAGQSDYAAGNAFMDAYAEYRHQLMIRGKRQGRTLAINWPLWKEGGMHAAPGIDHPAARHPLDTPAGVRALTRSYGLRYPCVALTPEQWPSATAPDAAGPSPSVDSESMAMGEEDRERLDSRVLARLKNLFAAATKFPVQSIDVREAIGNYGIDSVIVAGLNQELGRSFSRLPKTLFYEYDTLLELSHFLTTSRTFECAAWTAADVDRVSRPASPAPSKRSSRAGAATQPAREPIAIIGIAGHYPRAADLETFWRRLKGGESCITEIPSDRWPLQDFYEPDPQKARDQGKSYCRHGAFLEGFAEFDPLFFNIAPADAWSIDPQERLMLTTCREALEDSGYSVKSLADLYGGSVGVFAGVTKLGFHLLGSHQTAGSVRLPRTSFSSMANRVSFHLDLKGPSMAVDTMCSSFATALHEACEHIRRQECQLAFAGAVNLYLHPRTFVDLCHDRMVTGASRIHCFSADGQGFLPGEGVGAVLLKPLESAVRDGDQVYGVIRGTGVSHGGRTRGYMVPSLVQQRELVRMTLERAGWDIDSPSYIESAANGSAMGDAIEFEALRQVFEDRAVPCDLGSLKPQLGHLEAASGVCQLTKVLLQIKHGALAPTLTSAGELDPSLSWSDGPFRLTTEARAWDPSAGMPRRALITSYGAGGAYAVIAVEEYVERASRQEPRGHEEPRAIVISARTEPQLEAYVAKLAAFIRGNRAISLDDLSHTLAVGRDAMDERLAFVAHSVDEAEQKLQRFLDGDTDEDRYRGTGRNRGVLAEVFSDDDELGAAVQKLLRGGKLSKLLRLWSNGVAIDWSKLYDAKPHRRVSLPTYPFESRKFWHTATVEALDSENPAKAPRAVHEPERPSTLARTAIIDAVRELLLIGESTPVDEESPFFDLGLDSINVVRLMEKLSRKLGMPLAETLIFDHPTIDALAKHIAGRRQPREASAPEPPPRHEPVRAAGGSLKDRLGELVKRHEEIVPIQIEGDGPILFCIHPVSGDVGLYSKLERCLEGRIRLIGIKSRGFLTAADPRETIEEMGKAYAQVLADVDGEGPFHLFGASMGGTVAYECARNLQRSGKKVATLVLGESPLIEVDEDARLWETEHRQNLVMNANFLMIAMLHVDPEFREKKRLGEARWRDVEITAEEVGECSGEALVDSLVCLVRGRGVKQDERILKQRLRSMEKIHAANINSLARYRAQPLPQPHELRAILMRTKSAQTSSAEVYSPDYLVRVERAKGSLAPFLAGWGKLLPELETVVIEGDDHFELFNVQLGREAVANVIADAMRASGRTRPAPKPVRTAGAGRREARSTDIAVVGMAGRFPGAETLDELWHMLREGRRAFTPLPEERNWKSDSIYDPAQLPQKTYVRSGSFLSDIDKFDPDFFRILAGEAEMMEPAERLFLQTAWHAIEDAGVDPYRLSGSRWGVFCGSGGDYTLHLKEVSGMSMLVTSSTIPGRVAYQLNLTGPCHSVDAGCASSLLAIAQACDQLVLGKCDAAIAGGAMIYSTANFLVTGCQYQLFSPTEQCRAFDARADGMMPGEGVGAVVLKPLRAAELNGDRIHGVIEGWGNNHNGRTNGIASPSAAAQACLLAEVYERFRIDPATVTMVEANATGTRLGDAIEVQALTTAFGPSSARRQYCALGSIENNVGHSFANSGMAHLFRALLALRHEEIPATVNLGTLNPALDLANSPFFINDCTIPWQAAPEGVRRAAVNSLSATGTNVHLVLAQSPQQSEMSAETPERSQAVLIVLSARTQEALAQRCRDLSRRVTSAPDLSLTRLSANLLLRRAHFSERCALVVSSLEELQGRLAMVARGEIPDDCVLGSAVPAIPPPNGEHGLPAPKLTRDDLLQLASAYVQGIRLELTGHFRPEDMRPLSLPDYPFARNRYWAGASAPQDPLPEQSEDVAALLQQLISELTGQPSHDVNTQDHFSRFGMDSLMSMRLLAAVNERFRLDLFLTDLLELNNIERLANRIEHVRSRQAPETRPRPRLPRGPHAPEANWFFSSLSRSSDELHFASRPVKTGRANGSLPDVSFAGALIQSGVAILRDAGTVHFVAHESVDIERILSLLQPEQLESMSELPGGMLIAPESQEQERSLYHSEVMKQSSWNIHHVYMLPAQEIDLPVLEKAMARLLRDHDLLRTYHLPLRGAWCQVVVPETVPDITVVDLPAVEAFHDLIAGERNRLLAPGMPFKVWLCRTQRAAYLGFVMHHAHADAFTPSLIFAELMEHYHALLEGRPLGTSNEVEPYWQYALRQFDGETYAGGESLQYWRHHLAAGWEPTRLPYTSDPNRVDRSLAESARRHLLEFSPAETAAISRFNRDFGITYTQLFTAAVTLMLVRGMGNERASLQFINSQRDRKSLMQTPGDFTNVAFLSLAFEADGAVLDVLRSIKSSILNGLRHAKVRFSDLLRITGLNDYDNYFRQLSDVTIDSTDLDAGSPGMHHGRSMLAEELLQEGEGAEDEQALGTLFFQILKAGERIHLITSYRRHLFRHSDIRECASLVKDLVLAMVDGPERPVGELLASREDDFAELRARSAAHLWNAPHQKEPRRARVIEALEHLKAGLIDFNDVDEILGSAPRGYEFH
ncbi:MAG TPA: SDR family NAD(P)-dependent oxidoreductase [Thermoanaerobaculia bacterium]